MSSRRKIRFLEGEDCRAHCPSSVLGQSDYLVDIEACKGLGECGCKHFVCDVRNARREGETDWMKITCRHIRQVYHAWARREMERHLHEKRIQNGGRREDE